MGLLSEPIGQNARCVVGNLVEIDCLVFHSSQQPTRLRLNANAFRLIEVED